MIRTTPTAGSFICCALCLFCALSFTCRCHGSGKSALTAEFKKHFHTMDEGFMDAPPSLLHPQSLFMETVWVTNWFLRLMKLISEFAAEDAAAAAAAKAAGVDAAATPATAAAPRIIVADRSPLSAIFYSRSDGRLLEPLIRQYVTELREAADVHIVTVHLHTQRELLWSRICDRLEREPSRKAFREDQRTWMDAVCDFYGSMAWDVTVGNDSAPIPALAGQVMRSAAARHEDVATAVEACCAKAGLQWREEHFPAPAAPAVAGDAAVAAAVVVADVISKSLDAAAAANDDDSDSVGSASTASAVTGGAGEPLPPSRSSGSPSSEAGSCASSSGIALSLGLGLGLELGKATLPQPLSARKGCPATASAPAAALALASADDCTGSGDPIPSAMTPAKKAFGSHRPHAGSASDPAASASPAFALSLQLSE